MQFDPVTPDDSDRIRNSDPVDARPRPEDGGAEAHARTGLPAAFHMRHARHYVEQVMGDAPMRMVREIALHDLDEFSSDEDPADLQALESSIRAMGVLEPLLVTQQSERYRVVAGVKRLRAARTVGLRAVPCLVQDVDEAMLHRIREAVTVRAVPPKPQDSATREPVHPGGDQTADESTMRAVAADVNFVSALLPIIQAAGDDPLRKAVLTDLAAAELTRARTLLAAGEVLSLSKPLDRRSVAAGDLLQRAVTDAAAEARLRGVRLDVTAPATDYRISLDEELVSAAFAGLLRGAFGLAREPGALIRIKLDGTTIRPALILDIVLDDVEMDAATARRFYDPQLEPHPCGTSGSLLMAAVLRVARLHGGRADVQTRSPRGCTLTFVLPRPLTDF